MTVRKEEKSSHSYARVFESNECCLCVRYIRPEDGDKCFGTSKYQKFSSSKHMFAA